MMKIFNQYLSINKYNIIKLCNYKLTFRIQLGLYG